MSDFEDGDGTEQLPKQLEMEPDAVAQAKSYEVEAFNRMATISAGLALGANFESIAGFDTGATISLRAAGVFAVAAAQRVFRIYRLNRRNS